MTNAIIESWCGHVDKHANDYGEVEWVRLEAQRLAESAHKHGYAEQRVTWVAIVDYAQERLNELEAAAGLPVFDGAGVAR